jgi:ribosomal protein S18 acetylase RimI-like enzyme
VATLLKPLVQVRTMRASDVRYAAALHRECLPHGLFPALGDRFLGSYLFTYATSPFGIALIVDVDGDPAGFLVGSFDSQAHRSHVVRQHGTSLAIRAGIAMLCRPPVAWRFLRTRLARYALGFTRRRLAPSRAVSNATPEPRTAVLSHVAVAPSARGSSAGTTLVSSFVQRVTATEAEVAELLTRDDELGAGRFYASLGWDHDGRFTDRDGLRWAKFRIDLA